MDGLQRDHEPHPCPTPIPQKLCAAHLLYMCIFVGKGSLTFICNSKQNFRTNGLVPWVAPFLGYMLSQPPFSFCSLSPHPLGVPGTHLWPSPRLQAPFPAGYQPSGGLLPTHVHCSPGNTSSALAGGLCLGLGKRAGKKRASRLVGKGRTSGAF